MRAIATEKQIENIYNDQHRDLLRARLRHKRHYRRI